MQPKKKNRFKKLVARLMLRALWPIWRWVEDQCKLNTTDDVAESLVRTSADKKRLALLAGTDNDLIKRLEKNFKQSEKDREEIRLASLARPTFEKTMKKIKRN